MLPPKLDAPDIVTKSSTAAPCPVLVTVIVDEPLEAAKTLLNPVFVVLKGVTSYKAS